MSAVSDAHPAEFLRPDTYADAMDAEALRERAALVALLRARPNRLRWTDLMVEVLEAGSAREVWQRVVLPNLMDDLEGLDQVNQASHDIADWEWQGLTLSTILDRDYPVRLRGIHQAPPILFARGRLVPDDRAVSVVGPRDASEYGITFAKSLARELVDRGMTVVAGLARGIDTAAHRAALDTGGRTVAVIGSGINRTYLAANRALQEEIVRRGLVLSQFWPDAPPQKHTLLMRNTTMSGYSLATVVVEAEELGASEARARVAIEHGRPVILTDFVVSQHAWAKNLVGRPGIHVASSVQDVISILKRLEDEHDAAELLLRQLLVL